MTSEDALYHLERIATREPNICAAISLAIAALRQQEAVEELVEAARFARDRGCLYEQIDQLLAKFDAAKGGGGG
jgi:hypothetical protein